MSELSENIKHKLKDKGYKVFDLPFELNIVGIRKDKARAGYFDDELHVFARVGTNDFVHHVFNLVTDPGTYWLKKKGKPQNTLMLAEGQYKDCYQLTNNKKRMQLSQVKPVAAYPSYKRNAKLAWLEDKPVLGLYQIHFHAARSNGKYLYIPEEQQGAQVFQRKEDHDSFISMCEGHEKLHGNHFTYTLLDQRAQSKKRFTTLSAVVGVVIALISTFIKTDHGKSDQ